MSALLQLKDAEDLNYFDESFSWVVSIHINAISSLGYKLDSFIFKPKKSIFLLLESFIVYQLK